MGVVMKRVTVAANSETDVMTGTADEFPDISGSLVSVAAVMEAAGGELTVRLGNRTILEKGPLALVGANIAPKVPDDLKVVEEPAIPGERIAVKLINTTGAGILMSALVQVEPAGEEE